MPTKPSKLTKAPLAEVVFELRWGLDPQSGPIPQLRSDPGYNVLASNFTDWGRRQRFTDVEKVPGHAAGFSAGWTIERRLRKTAAARFPVWQIGPGIFAANDTSDYEWRVYKQHCLRGLAGVLGNYPELRASKLKPASLELRYLDIFSAEVVDGRDFVRFANEGTKLGLKPSEFLMDRKIFSGIKGGRLQLRLQLKSMKHTTFSVDLMTVRMGNGVEAIRLESKVHTSEQGLPTTKKALQLLTPRWLERAHEVTSPFFRSIVQPGLMEKFK